MVSLGDSYSSGEGIEPFYGQNESTADKVKNQGLASHMGLKKLARKTYSGGSKWFYVLKIVMIIGFVATSEQQPII